MNSQYKVEYLLESVVSSYLSMVSALALDLHLNRFKESVLQNLTDIKLSNDYQIPKKVQLYALDRKCFPRFSISCALRGVFSAIYEGMKHNDVFKNKITSLLNDNDESFFSIVTLLRNVYSHEISWAVNGEILLKKTDYDIFIKQRQKKGKPLSISINVDYSQIFPDVNAPHGYSLNVTVDLTKLADGEKLSSVISLYHQQMIADLCFNVCSFIS